MQSTAKDVPTYLEEAASDRQDVLQRLRTMCLDILDGYEETMEFGMPTYKRGGFPEISFASQKNYISLYVNPSVVEKHSHELERLQVGKSCIRYKKPQHIDFDVVRSLLTDTVAFTDAS